MSTASKVSSASSASVASGQPAPLRLSRQARQSAGQAISFLMQQAVENADCLSLAAGLVDRQTLPTDLAKKHLTAELAVEETGQTALQYGTTPGPQSVREVLCDYLNTLEQAVAPELRAENVTPVEPNDLILTTGSQQLLQLVAQAVFEPGDLCLVCAPTYFVFLGVLAALGVEAIPVDTDENGMCPAALQEMLEHLDQDGRLARLRMIYVVSEFDNPAGLTVSADRRPEIVRLAKEYSRDHRILVLEDAAYRELRYDGDPLPSLRSFDEDGSTVILSQTFSKSFSPGVRVGVSVLPKDLLAPVCDLKGNSDFGSAHLNQALIASVIRSGDYSEHVARVCRGYQTKRDALLAAAEEFLSSVEGVHWRKPSGGLYVWVTVPETVDTSFDSPLFRRATEIDKVMYVPGELCYPQTWDERPRHQMRLSFGVLTPAELREAIRRLANAIRFVQDNS